MLNEDQKAQLVALVEGFIASVIVPVPPVGIPPEEVEVLKQVAKAEGVLEGIAQEKAAVLAEVKKLEDLLAPEAAPAPIEPQA